MLLAAVAQLLFKPAEAAAKLTVGLAQCRLRVHRQIPRNVDENKKQVTDLILQQRPFGSIATIVALVAFVGGIFNVLEVFFVSTYLGYPAPFLGLLVSANAAGVLLGSAWFRQLDAHLMPITTFTSAVLGMGLTTAGFISSRDLGIAILWAAGMGVEIKPNDGATRLHSD